MSWRYALIGLVVSVMVGFQAQKLILQCSPDLGVLAHVDISSHIAGGEPWVEGASVEFDESMQISQYPNMLENNGMAQLLDYFKGIYNKHSMDMVKSQPDAKIPHIFHYIWLGRKLPNIYRPLLKTWLEAHPDWTFIFWVDNPVNYDLGTLIPDCNFDILQDVLAEGIAPSNSLVIDVKNLSYDNRVFFDEATNYGERSDILKWEVVYRLGGVYIDVDCECLRPLDALHNRYDFYCGIQPLDTGMVQLGAALFGAKPDHPILKHCTQTIKGDRHKSQIIVKTGPIHFTRSFLAMACAEQTMDVALPASYFYPCAYNQKGYERAAWMRPESFAVHHWAGSWLKPEGDAKNQAPQ